MRRRPCSGSATARCGSAPSCSLRADPRPSPAPGTQWLTTADSEGFRLTNRSTTAATTTPDPTAQRIQRRTMVVLVLMQVIGTVGVGVAPSIGVLLAGEVTDNEARSEEHTSELQSRG